MHDLTYGYSWSQREQSGTEPDGTAFTIFLRNLNEQGNGGFANHNNWRLPTCQELATIVDRSWAPAINEMFGPTQAYYYWSADTYIDYPHNAWAVNFGRIDLARGLYETQSGSKVNEGWIRAVRNA